jgi:DNA-binding GntR family transcriptional regulator
MRRGPGGGLIVAEPDPGASIEASALYLDYQGINRKQLRVVRKGVVLACLDAVADRVEEPEVARRLRVRRGTEKADPSADNPSRGSARLRQPGEMSDLLHLELAELAGNPVLALFLRILVTLRTRLEEVASSATTPTASHTTPAEQGREADTAVSRADQAIVEALLAGDRALARHRMRRNLDLSGCEAIGLHRARGGAVIDHDHP